MGLAFFAPWFFAGLAALAIPIIIHLVHRQNPQGILFPSLMFLRRIPYQERQRRRIRDWPLLLLRCLAMILLILAFARPFLNIDVTTTLANEQRRDLVLVLDQSYSMAYGNLWQQAVQQVEAQLNQLGNNDRAGLIVFADNSQTVSPLSNDYISLRSSLRRLQPDAGASNLAIAVNHGAQMLADSDAPQRQIVLISDFQRSAYDPDTRLRLPATIELVTLPVTTTILDNATVSGLTLTPQAEITLAAINISNTGSKNIAELNVSLTIDEQQLATQTLALAVKRTEAVQFDLPKVHQRPAQVMIQLSADSLEQDNFYYFVQTPTPQLSVLLINNDNINEQQTLYLSRALALSQNPLWQIVSRRLAEVQTEDISKARVIILNDVSIADVQLRQQLSAFVEQGGGLLVVAAQQASWRADEQVYLPGSTGPVSALETDTAISQIKANHPIFASFAGARDGVLSSARILRYRQLQATAADEVLARYADNSIALLERQFGKGRILVFSTTLDTRWNDLALQGNFLPLLHETLNYLSQFTPAVNAFTVADVVDIDRYLRALPETGVYLEALNSGNHLIVEAPSGKQIRVTSERAFLTLEEAGFYEIHAANSANKVLIAANVDTIESDFTPLDIAAFTSAIGDNSAAQAASSAATAQQPSALKREQQQHLWWYLLLSALILILLETALSNRLSRSVS